MSSQTQEPITVLSEHESWQTLAHGEVGRLAVSVAGHPDIFPVNYVVDGRSVLIKTGFGTKLLEATINPIVAFEADSYGHRRGWSVVVKGSAAVLDTEAEELRAWTLPLHSWLPTVKQVFIRITATEITGRRFAFGVEPDLNSY